MVGRRNREKSARNGNVLLVLRVRYLGYWNWVIVGIDCTFVAFQYGGVTSRQAILFALLAFVMASIAAWFGHQWIREALWQPLFQHDRCGPNVSLICVCWCCAKTLSQIHVSSAIAKQIVALPKKPSAIATTGYHEPSLVFLLGRNLLRLGAK